VLARLEELVAPIGLRERRILYLDPGRRSSVRLVAPAGPLGHDPFEVVLASHLEQSTPVLWNRSETRQRIVPTVASRLSTMAESAATCLPGALANPSICRRWTAACLTACGLPCRLQAI
jgi:hypothetical protein